MTPLKDAWMDLYTPVTENMKVDMRMNLKTRKVRGGRLARSVARAQCSAARAPRQLRARGSMAAAAPA